MAGSHSLAKKVAGVVAGVSLALTAAACGSDSDSAGGDSGTPTIRLANFGLIPGSAYFAWAVEGGFFEKHGVNVKLNPPMQNGADQVNSVVSGDADMAFANTSAVATSRNVGQPMVVVATTVPGYPLEVAFSKAVDEKLRSEGLSEDSPYAERIGALKGLTIGANPAGSSTAVALRYILGDSGMDPDKDVTIQPMPDLAAQVAALRAGKIDAIVNSTGGSTTMAKAQDAGVVWSLMEGSDAMSNFPYHSFVASEAFTKSNPEVIQKFLDAMYEARESFVSGLSDEDAAKIKEIVAPDMDQKIYDETMEGLRKVLTGPFSTSDEAWDVTVDITQLTSDKPIEVSADDAIDNTFADKVGQ